MHPTLEECNLDKNCDDPRTDQIVKGADSNLPGWQPKEKEAQLPHDSKADCLNNATPPKRPEAVGAPLVGRPADYLPSGTVGQWPPAT